MSIRACSHRKGLSFAVVAVFSLLAMAFFAAQSPNVSAASDPKFVLGYVKDSADRVLVGASITVNIRDDATDGAVLASKSDTTDGTGYYSVGFLAADWNVGDFVEVISDFSGNQIKVYEAAELLVLPFNQWINITYPYEIPEFGTLVKSSASVVSFGLIAIIIVMARRRRNAGPLAPL